MLLSCLSLGAQTTYTLEQCRSMAVENNYTIKSATSNAAKAEQVKKEAFTNFFPQISAMGAYVKTSDGMLQSEVDPTLLQALGQAAAGDQFGTALLQMIQQADLGTEINMLDELTLANVMAIQPIFMGGQIVNGNKLAKVGIEASKLQLEQAANEVELTAETYYWQVISLQMKKQTLKVVNDLLNTTNDMVKAAVDAGVKVQNDLLQVQLKKNEIASQTITVDNGLALSKMLLAHYIGAPDTAFVLADQANIYDLPQDPYAVFQAMDAAGSQNSVEYRLLQQQVEGARLQKKMETGSHMPSVAVMAGYNYMDVLDNGYSFGLVGATVSVPLSGWWGGSHAIKQKNLDLENAELQLADNAELLKIRTQKAWNDLTDSYKQLVIAKESIEQSDENYRLNKERYSAGTITTNDLLTAQQLYQSALDTYVDKFAAYRTKTIEYKQSIGQ